MKNLWIYFVPTKILTEYRSHILLLQLTNLVISVYTLDIKMGTKM